jgi:hypothetical protein
VTFEKHMLRSPNEIIFASISLLLYWSGLQKGADKECLAGGAAKMLHKEATVFANVSARPMLMITEG